MVMPWTDPRFETPPAHEPVFNAPILAVLVGASMPVLFFFQQRLPDGGAAWAFSPADLAEGRFGGLFTSMLLHGGWAHALMNAAGAVVFGAPVARVLSGARGVLAFFILYIGAGVLSALGYGLVHWGSNDALVGASGAVFGLIGAAMRLLGGKGRVLALTDPRLIQTSMAWMAVNLITGLIGLAPGVTGARIAWEAHAFGYLVGVLAIGPLVRWFGNTNPAFDSKPRLGDPVD
jgi:membrane associated rhomboid family serine protease